MSLLKKASIITTPTAYAEDYLYSIKPAIPFGEELITNLDFTSGWLTFGSVTINNSNTFTSSAAGGIRLDGLFITGRTYTATIIGTTAATLDIKDYSGSGAYGSTSGTFNYTFTFQAIGTGIYLRNSSAAATTIDSLSIKEMTDADFDFDRNSTGTRVNEDYLIEDVPYNLLRYTEAISTDFGVTDVTLTDNYSLSPSGTQTSTRAQLTNLGQSRAFNTVTGSVVSGQSYTFSCHYKGTQGQTVYINALPVGETEVSKAITLNGGWQRESVTFTAGSSSNYVYFVDSRKGGTATDFEVWGAQMVKGDQPKEYLKTTDRLDIPRIDYTNGEPSILLEPQRTNSITYSEDFDQWTKINVTVSSDQILAPDGTLSADKLIATSGASNKVIFQGITAGTYTASVFAKKGEFEGLFIGTGTVGAFFNLNTYAYRTHYQSPPTSYQIERYNNDWYRYSITFTQSGSNNLYIGPNDNVSTTLAITGDGSKGIYIYGAQLEAGSYATSLIHTSGSAVTRSADAADNAGNSDLINSTEGVLYAEIKALASDSNAREITISDGTTNNRVIISYNTANQIRINYRNSSTNIFDQSNNATITDYHKIAVKWKVNDFSFYLDGNEVASSTSGSVISANTLTTLNFDDSTGVFRFLGNVKMVAVFKEALSDTELECLTGYNNHELYMNYYNRLSYLGLVEEYNVESDINNYIL